MSNNQLYIFVKSLLILLSISIISSCANLGTGPQGGPRDTIPPVVVKEVPANGVLNFTGNKIEISFNEYIQLQDIQKNILMSPPQQNPPEVKAIGKTVSLVFQEPLLDSTTYTIDFGSAICDYNERTPLQGYVFSFSTGNHIDSLSISGCVYDAENLNPRAGVIVGIHANHADSSISTIPFTRITRTAEDGTFTIHNIRQGDYRLYALNDISRDFLYQPGEGIAIYDSIITPYTRIETHLDTVWYDTLGIDVSTGDTLFTRLIDTIVPHAITRYLPDSLVLMYFEENKQRHYFQRVSRQEQHAFTLVFSAPQDSLPTIHPMRYSQLDSTLSDSAWVDFLQHAMLQTNSTLDTLTYWLTDSASISMDTIAFEMTYMHSDSLYNLVSKTDTIMAVYRHPRISERAREAYERNKRNRKLRLTSNASSKFEIFDTLTIYADFPVDSIHEEMIHLNHRKDTILTPITFQLQQRDSLGMHLQLIANLKPSESYVLSIDSAAFRDIYGVCNDAIESKVQLRSPDEYAQLTVKLKHFDSRARIQLLNEKDEVLTELAAEESGAVFEHLTPTTYYLRMYLDVNLDQQWTTGDWLHKQSPEPVYYFPQKLKLRANWEFEENFDHLAISPVLSKPKSLTNKPSKKNAQ